ncbi:MAG: hypothetical protein ACRDP5_04670 [Streptosporangiaceae bacterium]
MTGQQATGFDLATFLGRIGELAARPGPAKLLAAVGEGVQCGWFDGEGYDPEGALAVLGEVLAAVPLLTGAVDAVRRGHQPRALRPDEHISWVPERSPVLVCTGCCDDEGETTEWPCPTMDAVIARLTGQKARGE